MFRDLFCLVSSIIFETEEIRHLVSPLSSSCIYHLRHTRCTSTKTSTTSFPPDVLCHHRTEVRSFLRLALASHCVVAHEQRRSFRDAASLGELRLTLVMIIQMVIRILVLPRLVGSSHGAYVLCPTSHIWTAITVYGSILWFDRFDLVLCTRGKSSFRFLLSCALLHAAHLRSSRPSNAVANVLSEMQQTPQLLWLAFHA